ncbi:MAG: radical SAM protein [Limnobacter sp.]|nr:radical SAM protein [Limnobacter sp.]
MHLVELLALRAVPAAGISLGITRRCPLNCSHCSTSSTMESEQSPSELFLNFVHSFSIENHPQFMAMSGGEALLRPRLVRSLALKARLSGTRSSVLSGMFFAREGKIPKLVESAIDAVDHFSASIDVFHEKEVPRTQVFKVLRKLIDSGKDLSLHIVGADADDPYLENIVGDVQKNFGQRIPMIVNTLSPFGRAKSFLKKNSKSDSDPDSADANPCTMAAWPVVGFDGVVAACGNDNLIGHVPSHLKLGDIHTDDWPTIQARCLQSSMPRALRIFGPQYIQAKFGVAGKSSLPIRKLGCDGYCDTCIRMDHDETVQKSVKTYMELHATSALEKTVIDLQGEMGPVAFANRYSHPRFANLVMLGARV